MKLLLGLGPNGQLEVILPSGLPAPIELTPRGLTRLHRILTEASRAEVREALAERKAAQARSDTLFARAAAFVVGVGTKASPLLSTLDLQDRGDSQDRSAAAGSHFVGDGSVRVRRLPPKGSKVRTAPSEFDLDDLL